MSSAQPHSRTPVPTSPSSPAPSSSSPPVPADPRDGGLGLCLTIAAWRDTASTPGQQTREPAGVADFTAEQLGPRELRRPALWVSNASGRPPAATGGSPTRSGWPGRRSSRAGSQPGAVVAGPFGDGNVAAGAGQHRAHRPARARSPTVSDARPPDPPARTHLSHIGCGPHADSEQGRTARMSRRARQRSGDQIGCRNFMITSGSCPHLPHHRRVTPSTRRG